MYTFKDRLKSVKFWSMTSISIQKLTDCSFYYTGYGMPCEDEVKCFFDGLSLGNQGHDDDLMIKHCKFSPNCDYLSIKISKRQDTSKEDGVLRYSRNNLSIGKGSSNDSLYV